MFKKPHKSNKTSYNFTLKSNDVATIRHDPIKSPIFCSLDIFFFSVHLLWWRMISVNSFMNKTRNSFIVGFNRQFIINTNTKKDRMEKYISDTSVRSVFLYLTLFVITSSCFSCGKCCQFSKKTYCSCFRKKYFLSK